MDCKRWTLDVWISSSYMGTRWPSSVSVESLAWDRSAFSYSTLLASDDTSFVDSLLILSLQLT